MGKEAAPGPMNPTSWRNCLENRVGSRIVVPKAAKWGPSRTDRPLPAAKEARLKGLRLFSKQFRKANSRKVIFRCLDTRTVTYGGERSSALMRKVDEPRYLGAA